MNFALQIACSTAPFNSVGNWHWVLKLIYHSLDFLPILHHHKKWGFDFISHNISLFISLEMPSKQIYSPSKTPSIFCLRNTHSSYFYTQITSIVRKNQKATLVQNNRVKKQQKITKVSLGFKKLFKPIWG